MAEVRCYEVKFIGDFENLPGYMVLKIGDKYYNFMRLFRTFRSVYEEIKDNLDELVYLDDEILKDMDIEMFFKESFEV